MGKFKFASRVCEEWNRLGDGIVSAAGVDPGIYFGEGQTKVPNRRLRAKPESRARSARELRAKPEPRAKPEKKRGEGSGEGLGEPLPRKFLKNQT